MNTLSRRGFLAASAAALAATQLPGAAMALRLDDQRQGHCASGNRHDDRIFRFGLIISPGQSSPGISAAVHYRTGQHIGS